MPGNSPAGDSHVLGACVHLQPIMPVCPTSALCREMMANSAQSLGSDFHIGARA
ncbi:hypothetical protein H2248_010652 [Termitomyces sp. 'cryptogamus']|nr:hypothetical protein H2248_010652 [Termitomyces sp. 'cryptogamus']